MPNASLVRLDDVGISLARNAGARAALGDYVAYIDDDAWTLPIGSSRSFALFPSKRRRLRSSVAAPCRYGKRRCRNGGRTPSSVSSPLPNGTVGANTGRLEFPMGSVLMREFCGRATCAVDGGRLRPGSGPARQHAAVRRRRAVGMHFRIAAGLSDTTRIVVHHCIQAQRLTQKWLLQRLYWQGASTVATRRMLGSRGWSGGSCHGA